MSLGELLLKQKVSFASTFQNDIKKKKSLIYDDGASKSRAETFSECKGGFDKLCHTDKKFLAFKDLFDENEIDIPFTLLDEDEVIKIQSHIRKFLYLLPEFLEIKPALQAVEWIVFKYEAHLHQPEDLLLTSIPLHDRPTFIKFIRLLDLNKKEFKWLQNVNESGRGINVTELSVLCLKNPHVLEMICSWPMKIIDVTESGSFAGKRMFKTVLALALEVIDKVHLKGSEKVEKYISPFLRVITEGFMSHDSDFISSAAFILIYLSYKITINEEFLKDCFKRILRNEVVQDHACLRTVLDIADSQKMSLCGKIEKLFLSRMSRLVEPELRAVDILLQQLSHNSECPNFSKVTTDVYQDMEVDFETKVKIEPETVQKDEDIVNGVMDKIDIDIESDSIERQLTDLLNAHVLTWCNNSCDRIANKVALEVVRLMKRKTKHLKINYQEGGITSYLCVALMAPWADVRRNVRHIFTKSIKEWPHMQQLKSVDKGEFINDIQCLRRDDIGNVLLTEINSICTGNSANTIKSVALELINGKKLIITRTLPNIWSLFLDSIVPEFDVSVDNLKINEIALRSLESTKTVFQDMSTCDQNSILDCITSKLDSSMKVINKAVKTLCNMNLSADNVLYLLKEVTTPNTKVKRNSIKKFNANEENEDEFYCEKVKCKIMVTLGAISILTTIPVEGQLKLIQPLFIILRKIITSSTNKSVKMEENSSGDMIPLMSNLMSALLTLLSPTDAINDATKASLSLKVRFEDITKCLYMFQNASLHNLILMVIQKLVKLGLGVEQFNLSYFMNWIGSNVVPRDDQHSMKTLNSVLEEILPVCVKMQLNGDDSTRDQVAIIASFVKDCSYLPKHRALMLYRNLIVSLSSAAPSSALWIQLLFMVVTKAGSDTVSPNLCLLVPLLKKFSKEEQLIAMKRVVVFLANAINTTTTSKKRKQISDEISNSPMQKKRRTSKEAVAIGEKIVVMANNMNETVREQLISMDKNVQFISLLKTMTNYFLMLLREMEDESSCTATTTDAVTDFMRGLFSAIKAVSSTPRSIVNPQVSNDVSGAIREMVDAVGSSLPRNTYLELIVEMVKTDDCHDNGVSAGVRMKAFELLSTRLGAMCCQGNQQKLGAYQSVLSLCRPLIRSTDCAYWEQAVSCVTSLIDLGCHADSADDLDGCYDTLVETAPTLTCDKVVVANIYIQKYVSSNKQKIPNLSLVFESAVAIIERCIEQRQLANGEVESSLAVLHSALCRDEGDSVGWPIFTRLLRDIFELTTLECVLRRLSRPSLDYQRQIRTRLSHNKHTTSLVAACTLLLGDGVAKKNVTHISGSASLIGCHLAHLNKIGTTLSIDDHPQLWQLAEQVLSFPESINYSTDVRVCEEIGIKALSQLCVVVDFDSVVLEKVIGWARASTVDAKVLLQRLSLVYRLLRHMSMRPGRVEQTASFISNSECIPLAAALLKHLSLSSQTHSRKKRRRSDRPDVLAVSCDDLYKLCPAECQELVESICAALFAHLSAENRLNQNLVVSDDSIDLITNVSTLLTSIGGLLSSKEDYVMVTEKFVIPLIGQMAANSNGDETLLTPMVVTMCKQFSDVNSTVHMGVLKSLVAIKDALGAVFDHSVREHVTSFLEDCKLHDEEDVADLANEI